MEKLIQITPLNYKYQSFLFVIIMEGQLVEYLDYVKPKRSGEDGERQKQTIIQEIYEQLQKYRVETIPKKQIKRPAHKTSILIELENHYIIAKIGKFQQQPADAVVLPYKSSELQYYPCSSFTDEFKNDQEKIKSLNSQAGELYLRSKKLFNYKFKAFIKMQAQTATKDITYGLNSLIKLITQKKIQIRTIAIIFRHDLFQIQQLLDSICNLEIPKAENPFQFTLILSTRQQLVNAITYLQ